MKLSRGISILATLCWTSTLAAQSVDVAWAPEHQEVQKAPVPPQRVSLPALAPAASLRAAGEGARDQLEAMNAWNRMGIGPTQNGFSRQLPQALHFAGAERLPNLAQGPNGGGYIASFPDGEVAWGSSISVVGAYRLRLHLSHVSLPPSAQMWVYGTQDKPTEFGVELQDSNGELWTPSVAGSRIFFEVRTPTSAASLVADKVMEVFRTNDPSQSPVDPAANVSCLTDATCINPSDFPAIAAARSAVAQLQFAEGGSSFLCSGGLLNNTKLDFIPYLLTAGHCFSDQPAAASLEAFWDYKTTSCSGSFPNEDTLPHSNGATLLATGSASTQSDFTFVRLNTIPPGRAFLGWTASASAIASGVALFRVSHPAPAGAPLPQSFSSTTVSSLAPCAPAQPPTRFIYSSLATGGTFGGSSGSPVMLADGRVVGQLLGICGPTAPQGEGCDPANEVMDGAFSATFPALAQWLDPAPAGGPCVRDATTGCLQGSRFEVKVTFNNDISSGDAAVMSFGGQRAEGDESAFYYFTSATNFEMGLKVLNACIPAFGNKYWVFISGLTDQGWLVTIRDTQTGAIKTYTNARHHLSTTFADTVAFACQ